MSNKNFTVILETKNELEEVIFKESEFEYEYEIDDVIGVFSIISNILYENNVLFSLKIDNVLFPTFSSELSIFLESLLKLTAFVNNNEILICEFDFYEQGVSYMFKFKKTDNKYYKLEFIDKENPSEIIQVKGPLLELDFMLYTFYSRVIFLAHKFCPSISSNEMFGEWKRLVNEQFGVN